MSKKTEKKRAGWRAVSVIFLAITAAAILGLVVWLVATGYAEAAMETVMRWGEDGTMDAFEAFVVGDVIPMMVGIAAAVGGGIALLLPTLKKLKEAKKQMDAGTEQAVSTYGERKAMQEEMQAFMEAQRIATEEMRREMLAAHEEMKREQRESLALDRAAMKRVENKVDGIRRMEVAAFGATGELVKKGTATQIKYICDESEGTEACEGEGGDSSETVGDDDETVKDEKAN